MRCRAFARPCAFQTSGPHWRGVPSLHTTRLRLPLHLGHHHHLDRGLPTWCRLARAPRGSDQRGGGGVSTSLVSPSTPRRGSAAHLVVVAGVDPALVGSIDNVRVRASCAVVSGDPARPEGSHPAGSPGAHRTRRPAPSCSTIVTSATGPTATLPTRSPGAQGRGPAKGHSRAPSRYGSVGAVTTAPTTRPASAASAVSSIFNSSDSAADRLRGGNGAGCPSSSSRLRASANLS